MSEVRWGLAGQASEPGVSCQSEAVSALDRAAPTEWRLLNNGHIWSEHAEVAGHGLLVKALRLDCSWDHGAPAKPSALMPLLGLALPVPPQACELFP
ncbi:hypothetical protein LEMLEM_LOCUS165 [Lemmus lemmus]